ncbi:MAG: FkbM family methyltransferase [Phycisphaerales bacterium]|nr:FkbM family methyltransferase [Phycisphaerales bacterium]
MLRYYSSSDSIPEPVAFSAGSSLAPLTFEYSGRDILAIHFACRGFNDWRNVVVANILCSPGDTIVEIGAHLGTETIHFGAVVGSRGRVVAFEPVPEHVTHLRSTLRNNHLDHVEVVEAAISNENGRITFYMAPNETNQGQGSMWAMHDAESEKLEVETVTLDSFCETRNIESIKLIVTDAEGGEPDILEGASKVLAEARPYLLMENNPDRLRDRGLTSQSLCKQVQDAGYNCHEVGRFGLTPPNFTDLSNWVGIPNDDPKRAHDDARRLHRAIRRAGMMPLWRMINPAVIGPRR